MEGPFHPRQSALKLLIILPSTAFWNGKNSTIIIYCPEKFLVGFRESLKWILQAGD